MDLERLTRLAPVQDRFGPTLPQLLVPRIDRLPSIARRVGALALVVVIVVIVAVVLRSRDPVFAASGPPAAFHTSYPRSLKRVTPPPGALLMLEQRDPSGHLIASFEITRVRLPPYSGEISGLWPIFAWNYMQHLRATLGPSAAFLEQSDGRTRIINTPAYTYSYSTYLGSTLYFGRVVFITPALKGDRYGLALSMLETKSALKLATHPIAPTPDQVGTVGVLFEPLERLRFG